jgi:hypothetical protein
LEPRVIAVVDRPQRGVWYTDERGELQFKPFSEAPTLEVLKLEVAILSEEECRLGATLAKVVGRE